MAQYQPVPHTGSGEPPLDWPWVGIGFTAAVKRVFQKYATFSGRASRGEFWWWFLAIGAVQLVLGIILNVIILSATTAAQASGASPTIPGGAIALYVLFVLIGLAVIVPHLAVSVRRLHDAGYSGWYYLLSLIPFAGGIILIILCAMPTSPKAAIYGPPADQGYPPAVGPYGQQPGYPAAQPTDNPYGQAQPGQQGGYPPAQPGDNPYGQAQPGQQGGYPPAQPGDNPYGQQGQQGGTNPYGQ